MKQIILLFTVIFFVVTCQTGFSAPRINDATNSYTEKEYISIAYQRQSAGLYEEAEELLLLANVVARKNNNIDYQVTALIGLGDLYLISNRMQMAENSLKQAEDLVAENNSKHMLPAVLINKGNLYIHNGEIEKAIDVYERSSKISLTISDDKQRVISLINLSRALVYKKDYKKSFVVFYDVLALVSDLPPSPENAFQLASIASLAQDILAVDEIDQGVVKMRQQIAELYDRASLMAEQTGDFYTASYAYGSLAPLYQEEKRYKDAQKLLRRAILLASQAEAEELLYQWKWNLGRIHRIQGDTQDAINEFRQAIEILQRVRPRLSSGSRNNMKGFRESSGRLYFELADLLLDEPDTSVSSKEREQQLIEARQTVELLKAVELQDYFRDNCVTALRSRTSGIDQLDPHTAVLYVIPLKDRLELLLSLPDRIEQVTVSVREQVFRAEIEQFRRNLETRTTRRYVKQAMQLYDWLIRPLKDVLEESKITTLVTVPQGALMSIPIAALHDGNQFLIEQFALATTPGLTLTEPKALKKEDTKVLLAGISESVQGFPALPYVPKELSSIQGTFDGRLYRDADFSSNNINLAMQSIPYSIVHLASHAQFKGRSDDTFLLTHVEKLDLDALEALIGISEFRDDPVELLTLSACQTAAGNDQAALGLAGIAIKAGARSALASLWFVSDSSTSGLMSDFYSNLQKHGVSKAQALQQAQIDVLKDRRYRHPAYWAAFLLIGNWL